MPLSDGRNILRQSIVRGIDPHDQRLRQHARLRPDAQGLRQFADVRLSNQLQE